SQDLVETPSPSQTLEEDASTGIKLSATSTTPQAATLPTVVASASPSETNISGSHLVSLPHIAETSSHQTSSDSALKANPCDVDENACHSTTASTSSGPHHSLIALAAPSRWKIPHDTSLSIPKVVLPPLSTLPEAHQPKTVKVDLIPSRQSECNSPSIPSHAEVGTAAPRPSQPGPAKCNFNDVSVPLQRPGMNGSHPAEWECLSMRHLSPVTTFRGRKALDHLELSRAPPIHASKFPRHSASYQCETSTPTLSPEPTFDSPKDTLAQEAECVLKEVLGGEVQGKVESSWKDVHWQVQDVSAQVTVEAFLGRGGEIFGAARRMKTGNGRRPRGTGPSAAGDSGAEDQVRTNPQSLDSRPVGPPIPSPPTQVPSEFEVYVDGEGFPTRDVEMALQESIRDIQVVANCDHNRLETDGFPKTDLDRAISESLQAVRGSPLGGARMGRSRFRGPPVPTTATSESSDEEEDDVDSDGFSKIEQKKAAAVSRAAATVTPFYGEPTSRAAQQLSDEEWASLDQFTATSSSLTEVASPQVPLSAGVETDEVQGGPPLPPPAAGPVPAKIKGTSRTKKSLRKSRSMSNPRFS
ncbi:hypothetical protein FRC01_000138, partial [Tulasnella sp. 417]